MVEYCRNRKKSLNLFKKRAFEGKTLAVKELQGRTLPLNIASTLIVCETCSFLAFGPEVKLQAERNGLMPPQLVSLQFEPLQSISISACPRQFCHDTASALSFP